MDAKHPTLTIEATRGGPSYVTASVEPSRHAFAVGAVVPAPDSGVRDVVSNAVRRVRARRMRTSRDARGRHCALRTWGFQRRGPISAVYCPARSWRHRSLAIRIASW